MMTPTSRRDRATAAQAPGDVLVNIVEKNRKRMRISLRLAAERAGISESTWRQLVAGGVNVGGKWVNRTPRRDQVLDMALAVECLEEAVTALAAGEEEVMAARERVVFTDPAETEILNMRHLRPNEKLRLLDALHTLRDEV
jgi:hypothetical protein